MSNRSFEFGIRFTADGKIAVTEAGKVEDAIKRVGPAAKKTANTVAAASQSIINAIQREIATLEAGKKSAAGYFESLAKQKGVDTSALAPYLTQLTDAQKRSEEAALSMGKVGISGKQLAFALRGVPAQFTDIATSIASGQSPMLVMLQQGGQLKDMFGGVGPAAKALGGYVVGLISPLTVGAAALAAVGLAYYQGSQEADAYRKAIILSGNATGVTAGQLQVQAAAVAAASGQTQGAIAEVLAMAVNGGKITSDNLGLVADAATRMHQVVGTAVETTVGQFNELGKSPVEASIKLDSQYNYLTLSVYRQIKALEDEGRTVEAAAAAQKAYGDALIDRAGQIEENLGYIERGWNSVAHAGKAAWDAMLGVGRQASIETRIKELEAKRSTGRGSRTRTSAEDAELDFLKQQAAGNKIVADAEAANNARKNAGIELDQKLSASASNTIKRDKELAANKVLVAKSMGVAVEELSGKETALLALNATTRKKYAETEKVQRAESSSAAIETARKTAAAEISAIELAHTRGEISERQYLETIKGMQQSGIIDQIKAVDAELGRTTGAAKRAELIQKLNGLWMDWVKAENDGTAKLVTLDNKRAEAAAAAWQTQFDGIEKAIAAAQAEIDASGKTADQLSKEAIQRDQLNIATLNQAKAAFLAVDASEATIAVLDREIERNQRMIEGRTRLAEVTAVQKQLADQQATNGDLQKSLDKTQEEIRLYGLTEAQIHRVLLARKQEQLAIAEVNLEKDKSEGKSEEEIAKQQKVIDAIKAEITLRGQLANAGDIKKGLDEQAALWKSIESTAHDTFISIGDSGKAAFDRLRDTLKNGLYELLYQMTVKQWLINISASVSGTSTGATGSSGSSLSSLLSGGNAGSALYSTLATSSIGQALGLSSTLLASGSSVAAAAASAVTTTTALTSATTGLTTFAAGSEAATAGLTALGSTIGAAIPYVAAAIAIYSAFAKPVQEDPHDNADSSGLSVKLSKAGVTGSGTQITDEVGGGTAYTWVEGQTSGQGRWNDGTALSSDATALLDAQTKAVFASGAAIANALGLTADGLDDVSVANARFASAEAALSALSDEVARAVLPSIADFRGSGETLAQTLVRVATNVKDVEGWSARLGLSLDGLTNKNALATAFGGSTAMDTALSAYYSAYYSDSERQAQALKEVDAAIAALNVTVPQSKDEFRALVSSLDLSTAAGQATYASLVALAPAFSEVMAAVSATVSAADTATATAAEIAKKQRELDIALMTAQGNATGALAAQREDELAALAALNPALAATQQAIYNAVDAAKEAAVLQADADAGASAIMTWRAAFAATLQTIEDYAKSLSATAATLASPEAAYLQAQQAFSADEATMMLGRTSTNDKREAIKQLPELGDSLLAASKDYFGSAAGYFDDLASVQSAVKKAQVFLTGVANDKPIDWMSFNGTANGNYLPSRSSALYAMTGLPQYANGGDYLGGLALVGEKGPELINFSNPGYVYTAEETKAMMSNSGSSNPADNTQVVTELQALVRLQAAANQALVAKLEVMAEQLGAIQKNGALADQAR